MRLSTTNQSFLKKLNPLLTTDSTKQAKLTRSIINGSRPANSWPVSTARIQWLHQLFLAKKSIRTP